MFALKLPVAAALFGMAAIAVPASAQPVVHHETVVTKSSVVHPAGARMVHENHRVCHNYWSHHRRIHQCRTVHWSHHA